MSYEAFDLINKLLTLDPNQRLGKRGVQEIKNHHFFNGIEWDKLRDNEGPIVPFLKEESDGCLEGGDERNPFHGNGHQPEANANQRQLKGFNMRRIDLLYKMNQECYRRFLKELHAMRPRSSCSRAPKATRSSSAGQATSCSNSSSAPALTCLAPARGA